MSPRRRRSAFPRVMFAALCLALGAGCRTAPPAGSGVQEFLRPPFFPFAAENDRREPWDPWGRRNLQHGDVLFVMGESYVLLGLLNFSKFSAEIARSEFSHVAVIAAEEEGPVVYEITTDGVLRTPFGEYMKNRRTWAVAVKRLHPARWGCIPSAIEFCRQAYRDQPKFDNVFRADNDRYYCAELVEVAFRQAGQPLSDPIAIDALPGYANLSPATVALVESMTAISADQEVFLPGNDAYGIWSCPALMTVLEKTDADSPPPVFQEDGAPVGTLFRPPSRPF